MKTFALALGGLLMATTLNAQVYEWKDESGKTHYSDKPPAGSVRQQRPVVTTPTPSASNPALVPAQKTAADRELEFRKRQKEAQENAEKQNKEQIAAAELQANCASARRQLQALESGDRISMQDDKGQRYFLEDAQREQEVARIRRILGSSCK